MPEPPAPIQDKNVKTTELEPLPKGWEVVMYLKKVIRSLEIEAYKIFIFGSRARGESTVRSDYDFLILIKEKIDFEKKREVIRAVRRRMSERLIPVDMFIISTEEFEKYRTIVGNIVYSASREGIEI
ncbi:nucleotidyltransferase [Methanosarcinales archaeon ex4572_44]|nr:MAG: nucleotidyltransferase [Methanosarcinales archaeon ex4572_44]